MPDDEAQEAGDEARASQDESAVSRELRHLSLEAEHQQQQQQQQRPSLPRILSNGVVATDITARFTAAASTLQPGEVVKDGYFTLFESVGALEIMDPKMDSGSVPDDTLEEDEYAVDRALLPAEVIGLIDQLWCLEMAWHLGYPLSQTLLTSVYISAILVPQPPPPPPPTSLESLAQVDFVRGRRPEDLQRSPAHAVLRAYCLALIKTCGHVMQEIKAELFYEVGGSTRLAWEPLCMYNNAQDHFLTDVVLQEEDFSANTYNLPLFEDTSRDDLRQILQDARAAVADGVASHGWPADAAAALAARLDFRDTFFAGLASTMPPRPVVQPAFAEAAQRWQRFCEDGAEAVGILQYAEPQSLLNYVLTFQAKTPQPLIYIRSLVQTLLFADNIVLGALSIRQLMDDDLALVAAPASVLLDRANDQVEAVHDPRFVVAQQMEEFRQRAFPAYADVFRTWCQNRSRARRMLCHALQEWERVQLDAEELDQRVQAAVDQLPAARGGGPPRPVDSHKDDDAAPALPLSSWAFLYKLRLMEWVVQLGFELEIYQPDELAGMYAYLCTLAKRRVQHAERIRSFTLRSLNAHRQRAPHQQSGRVGGGGGAGGGGSRSLTPEQEASFTRSLLYLRTTLLDASVVWELADALAGLYTALQRTRVLPVPARPYGADALRYKLRMRPFAAIELPALPPADAFQKHVEQADVPVTAVLANAAHAVAGAKKGCEALARCGDEEAFAVHCHGRWLASTQSVHKAAIATGLAVAALQRAADGAAAQQPAGGNGGGGGGNDDPTALKLAAQVPTPDKCYHPWWIVPKLTPTA
ncbi:Mak10 subunit, NatC N(alpha)-terminal acetyltransferase [Niveomyces insectorum RCEF 264]|uniref:Mak10 subunit, NatC N(Alpha)-terminal acetyltransferase n=1 Tax=Niveomyces insectorum RCEF 264 TaxID=1081102 RepID=A0A167ZSS4_9HYPO|nr:Mak10 subunit, NatC N(alpha)-terminal acetyltransferase [Niveomyces insectorum RCEF 264]